MNITASMKQAIVCFGLIVVVVANGIIWFLLGHAIYHIFKYDVIIFWETRRFLIGTFVLACAVFVGIVGKRSCQGQRVIRLLFSVNIVMVFAGSAAWIGLLSSPLLSLR